MLSIYNETLFLDNIKPLPAPVLGDFSNKICLFIDKNSNNDICINLLLNILKACNLDLHQSQLFCISNPIEESLVIFKAVKPKFLICFGIPFTNELMQLHIRKNDIIDFGDAKILSTVDLQSLQTNSIEKSALWKSLRILFDIK
jgi:DNA polymerase III psi subunit